MASMTRFTAAGDTNMGLVRQNNEDALHVDPELGIFIVVDGVGGHAAGEQAAAIATETIYTRLRRQVGSVESRIREAITLANNDVFDNALANEEWRGMACVLTVAVVDDASLVIGHVGDTRLYKIHRGAIRKITPDHSPVGEREDAGELSEIEAMNHPRRNEVYRDVGTERHDTHDEGFIEIIKTPFESDSAWIMCSDGLSDLVTSWQIQETVESHAGDLSMVVRLLIDAANDAGGKDNVTVIYIECEMFARTVKNSDPSVKAEVNDPYEGETTQLTSSPNGGFFKKDEPGVAPAPLPSPIYHANQAQRLGTESQPRPPQPQVARPVVYSQAAGREERPEAGSLLLSRAALFAYGFIVALAIAFALQVGGVNLLGSETSSQVDGPRKLAVGPDKQFQKISKAIEAARPGDTIEVEPGVYQEQISLDGIDNLIVISRVPNKALIYSLQEGREGGIAVSIANVASGRFSGFKILGDERQPLSVGIRINNATVEITDNEIVNINRIGVEIIGPGAPILRGNYIHNYQSIGVQISGEAKPTLERNIITYKQQPDRNGKPAIHINQIEMPDLQWNTIYKNDNITGVEGNEKNELLKKTYLVPSDESEERNNQPPAQRQPRGRRSN